MNIYISFVIQCQFKYVQDYIKNVYNKLKFTNFDLSKIQINENTYNEQYC